MNTEKIQASRYAGYAEFKFSRIHEIGWDVLDVFQEDVPYEGTIDVPVLAPGGYFQSQCCSIKSLARTNVFLLGKLRDQSPAERDAEIGNLKTAPQTVQNVNEIPEKNSQKLKESLDHVIVRANHNYANCNFDFISSNGSYFCILYNLHSN